MNSKSIKVIIFTYLFPNSISPTSGIFNLSRAKALINLGCEVIVVAPISLNLLKVNFIPHLRLITQFRLSKLLLNIPKVESYKGIKVYHPKWYKLPNNLFWKDSAAILHYFIGNKVNKIIKEFEPDLIISTWLNPFAAYSRYLPNHNKLKKFALAEGSDVLVDSVNYNGWEKIENIINQNCNILIAVSDNMKNHFQLKTKLQNIKVIRNGYDDSIFVYQKRDPNKKNKVTKIITVANFQPAKGQEVLLESLKWITIPIHVTLVGDGPLLKKYQNSYQNLNGKVDFIGPVPHDKIPELLINHDIFCMPSHSEGLPSAPIEAMACGLPVVGTNVGGLSEIIIEGFNGYLCKSNSPHDLADKITAAANRAWDKEEISQWTKNNFSWKIWADQIIRTYENI